MGKIFSEGGFLKTEPFSEFKIGGFTVDVKKYGMKIPFTWEALLDNPRNGHYEPTGIKWVQWLSWLMGLIVFKLWAGLEKTLRKFRHFEEVWGYEYEEAEYRPFKQRRRWVSDE